MEQDFRQYEFGDILMGIVAVLIPLVAMRLFF